MLAIFFTKENSLKIKPEFHVEKVSADSNVIEFKSEIPYCKQDKGTIISNQLYRILSIFFLFFFCRLNILIPHSNLISFL